MPASPTALPIPANVKGVYWEYYHTSSLMPRLTNIDTDYNLVYLFQALPIGYQPGTNPANDLPYNNGGTTGGMQYYAPGVGSPTANQTHVPNVYQGYYPSHGGGGVADIATAISSQNRRIILSLGGANAGLRLSDYTSADLPNGGTAPTVMTAKARCDNFIQSVKNINNDLAAAAGYTTGQGNPFISGIDLNFFEHGHQPVYAAPRESGKWMTYCCLRLKDFYGQNFIITSPPAAALAQRTEERLLMMELYDGNLPVAQGGPGPAARAVGTGLYDETLYSYKGRAIDFFGPQYYDSVTLTDHSLVLNAFGNNSLPPYQDPSRSWFLPVTMAGRTISLPTSGLMGVGYAVGTGTSRWTATEAMDSYDDLVTKGLEPKGAYNFSVNESTLTGGMSAASAGHQQFIDVVGPVINNNEDTAPSVPTITSINPTTKFTTNSQFVITVNGTNFSSGGASIVWFAGSAKATTYVSSTQLTAIIPIVDFQYHPGSYGVVVVNGGIETSNAQALTVSLPAVTPTTLTGIGSMTGVGSIIL